MKKINDSAAKKSIVIIAAVIISAAAVCAVSSVIHRNNKVSVSETDDGLTDGTEIDLGSGLFITGIGPYTGAYFEDGSNENVSHVLMIALENRSDKVLQFAEITLSGKGVTAIFNISTLPPGTTAVALEKYRQKYIKDDLFSRFELGNKIFFEDDPPMCEDRVKLETGDGELYVTNISDHNIDGKIIIYYKNYLNGIYYGGITYRVALNDGLSRGEVKHIDAPHFSEDKSVIMFVTCP